MDQSGDRAASEIIGAVILFGFLVMAFTTYQGVIVPQQNKAIEFNHNEAVHDSIQDLRNAIRQTATTAAEESVSIKLGPTYPERVLAINPGAPAGVIVTQDLGSIHLQNITATDPEAADYFGDSTTTLGRFDSKVLLYSPIYIQYQLAPNTLYENTVAYNQFPSGVNLSITDQAVIDDRKITLIALDGNVSAARQGAVSVDTKALSTASNAVTVRSKNGPINITFNTRLTRANWSNLLANEMAPDGHVLRVKETGPNQVSIILEEGVSYELRLAKVGVGTRTTGEPAKYLVDVEGDDTSVIENGTQRLEVEVRDRFNNPVSNVSVTATITTPANSSNPGSVSPTSPGSNISDANGVASFIYDVPEDVDGASEAVITAEFDGDGTVNETVEFNVLVLDADGSGGGDEDSDGVSQVNPSGDNKLVLESSIEGNPKDTAELQFNNTADSDITAVKIRVPFYFADSQNQADVVEDFAGTTSFGGSASLSIGAPLTDLDTNVTFSPGTSTETIDFDGDNVQTRGDFFILVLELDNGATVTYFVAPQ